MRLLLALAFLAAAAAAPAQSQTPDVIYVPTPQEVVDEMLKLARVGKNDILYDLGSGDGRIPVTAAKRFGIRAYGIDIDPQRIQEANENAKKNGVTNLVQFRNEDLFKSKFSDATVVTLYLLPDLNVKLRPRLLAELKPGTRIVSHQFDMGTWQPDKKVELNGRTIYLWTIPERKSPQPPK
jgi:trans-aconitate methyltransferase